jgi:hypothetical protein
MCSHSFHEFVYLISSVTIFVKYLCNVCAILEGSLTDVALMLCGFSHIELCKPWESEAFFSICGAYGTNHEGRDVISYKTRVYTDVERERERERHFICVSLMLVVYYRLMRAKVIFYSFLWSHVTNMRAKNSCCVSTKIGLENVEGTSKAFRILWYPDWGVFPWFSSVVRQMPG